MSRFTEARNNLILGQPFFGALSLRLDAIADPAIDTMGVDGKTLRYNPEWIEALPFDELVGVVAHEVMHCAAGHHARRGARDNARWNGACDYAINPMLIDSGFKLPAAALVRDDLKGMSAEEIYTRLAQEDSSKSGENDTGDQAESSPGDDVSGETTGPGDVGGCGSFSDGPGEGVPATQAELAEMAREWEIATMQAAAAAKAAGQMPDAGSYLVDQIKKARVNWREILREFVSVQARNEVSWIPPNRRYVHQGLYLPGASGREMGEMVVVVDCSGSCWGPMLADFGTELNGILEDVRPEKVHVLYWDTQCQGYAEHEADDLPIKIEPRGGGGTAFDGIWPWIAEQGIDPTCLVCLTDLDASFGAEPDYPVLWCSTGAASAPFGEVVKLELTR